ncbi:hypothetical protein BDF21DRAFT_417848 [Thamnidium elegans]|nr:hypothetical protein BDF21DRAFT_417848 [Thamnidium elegans]
MQKTIILAILSSLYLASAVYISDQVCHTEEGLYPSEDNCDEYISCEDGIPYVHICPEGLQFNTEYSGCEPPLTKGSCTFDD